LEEITGARLWGVLVFLVGPKKLLHMNKTRALTEKNCLVGGYMFWNANTELHYGDWLQMVHPSWLSGYGYSALDRDIIQAPGFGEEQNITVLASVLQLNNSMIVLACICIFAAAFAGINACIAAFRVWDRQHKCLPIHINSKDEDFTNTSTA
jgi:hypothetical protein